MKTANYEPRTANQRLLHCGVFSDLFIADLVRHAGIRASAFGLEVLKGDRNDAFDSITTADEIAKLTPRHPSLSWSEQRERGDATLKLAGFDRRFDGFDLYHLHTLFVKGLWQLDLIPLEKPIVLSIWGSDLLRVAGEYEYGRQLAALRRASLVTVQSLELREILLAKFGRELGPKVRLTTFGSARLPLLKTRPSDARLDAFRAEQGIPKREFTVVLGHAATPFDRHLEMLAALSRLPDAWRDRIAFILPMAYGGKSDYVDSVRATIAKSPLNAVVLPAMLNDEQIVCLRHLSDAMVYLPESDALSGSVQEAIYAGASAVVGSWLPYNTRLRRSGVFYRDVVSFDELPLMIVEALSNRAADREAIARSRPAIEELSDWSKCVRGWLSVYREACSEPQMNTDEHR
jgi:glycosyltransferase involved in cell wall biosynthesis